MTKTRRRQATFGLMAFCLTLTGCGILSNDDCFFRCERTRSGSTPLVQFLYGNTGSVPKRDAQVELRLPIRVGLAFLPSRQHQDGPTPLDKQKVLDSVRKSFGDLPYVSEIVALPDYYFDERHGDGMQQVEQLARLHRLDLMALISYDQQSHATENRRALGYLTIVGALVMRGNHNETQTIVDLAVVEPTHQSLVLRAGGTSASANTATAVDQARKLERQQRRGFEVAADNMIGNFRTELLAFEERVRAGTADVRVVRHDGRQRGGGGAVGLALVATLAVFLSLQGARAWRGR